MRRVLLDTGVDDRRVAWLRTPTGADELSADGGVDALLDRCLEDRGVGSVMPGSARRLSLADRDRLLLAVERMLFGDQVDADTTCTSCGAAFSLRFSLASLVDARQSLTPEDVDGPDERGHYRLQGLAFRLPTAEDLDRAATAAPAERAGMLLRAVVLSGDIDGHEDVLEQVLAALAPPLDVDLDASCPHCASHQRPRFSLAAFLDRQLANERRFVLREVHRLARAYGWTYEAILSLPRPDRHDFVALVESEMPRGASPLAGAGAMP